MTDEQMASAFNEWMRRYTEDPAKFEAEFQTVGDFLCEQSEGEEPSYGKKSAAYMRELVSQLEAKQSEPD